MTFSDLIGLPNSKTADFASTSKKSLSLDHFLLLRAGSGWGLDLVSRARPSRAEGGSGQVCTIVDLFYIQPPTTGWLKNAITSCCFGNCGADRVQRVRLAALNSYQNIS